MKVLCKLRVGIVNADPPRGATQNSSQPEILNIEKIFAEKGVDFRFFGKPQSHNKRRMGVILAQGDNAKIALEKARYAASQIILK